MGAKLAGGSGKFQSQMPLERHITDCIPLMYVGAQSRLGQADEDAHEQTARHAGGGIPLFSEPSTYAAPQRLYASTIAQ